jgi:thioesterase domain-containing protein
VHVDDDFFDDLGGESVVAAHLVTEVERRTGRAIPLSLLLEVNTARRMAEYLRGADEAARHAVRIQEGSGALPPLFCVAGGGGSVMVFRDLAAMISPELAVYGLQPHSFAPEKFPKSFGAIAACYADAIRRIQPHGPYYLAGYSMGGHIAYEAARQMTAAGERVAFLGLIDTAAQTARLSIWKRLAYRLEMLHLNPKLNVPRFAREFVNRSRKRIERRLQDIVRNADQAPASVHETFGAMAEAQRGFRLEPYEGPVTLFRGRDGIHRVRKDEDLGWGNVGIGRLDIVDVDGDHETVLAVPQVRTLAAAFASALASARGAGSGKRGAENR